MTTLVTYHTNGTAMQFSIRGGTAGGTTGLFAPNRIYVLPGSTSSFPPVNYVNQTQVYNPEINSWAIGTPITPLRVAVGLAIVNDELYIIGGYDGENYRDENEKYTPIGYIPEFPSWAILPLFLSATLVIVFFRKNLKKSGNIL